jgi:formamidopyrimidine-DNA glycosylase
MPELAEVETFRRKIEKIVKNKTIKEVEAIPDKVVFEKKSPGEIRKFLLDRKVKKCCRKGKYLWFELDKPPWPVFHLGMTGSYIISDTPPDKNEKNVKLILKMSNGKFIIFKDPRRFGRVMIKENPLHQPPLVNLGPDAMNELPSYHDLHERFHERKSPVKTILLDQSFLSGIGNWMSDEILYQSGIKPHKRSSELTLPEVRRMHSKIKAVTKTSVAAEADDANYPKNWIFHQRWKKKDKVSSGKAIRYDVVGGRTTAWVPDKQH